MIILGAGLAGCLAGTLLRNATIFEAGPGISNQHKAVLRFREDSIGHAIGVPFKKVRVHKSIFIDGKHHHESSPLFTNMYSKKVTGKILPRSINDLSPVERFIAPSNLHEILGNICRGRIHFNTKIESVEQLKLLRDAHEAEAIVSTIPMPVLLGVLGIEHQFNFQHAPIYVSRWRVPDCDTHQTVYFPGMDTPVYRATLTGEDLIIEASAQTRQEDESEAANSFFIPLSSAELVSRGSQRFGKILPLPDEARKEFLLSVTFNHHIYSLGRFACWRNILLDDVYHDLRTIQQMIKLHNYDLIKAMT